MIRLCLLAALVACSKSPHAPPPPPPPEPAIAIDASQVFDAQLVDAQVFDAQPLDAPVDAPHAAARAIDAGVKPAAKLGKLGDICAYGVRRNLEGEERAVKRVPLPACGPGLQCCYPCGIPGCDSVCKPTCPAVP